MKPGKQQAAKAPPGTAAAPALEARTSRTSARLPDAGTDWRLARMPEAGIARMSVRTMDKRKSCLLGSWTPMSLGS